MNVNELRIGNLLTSKSWYGVHPVSGIDIIDDGFRVLVKGFVHDFIDGEHCDLEPILLTPEILLKCGFKKYVVKLPLVNWIDYRKGNMVINITDGGYEIEFGSELFSIEDRTHITCIKYLHQLQNLYFALTNTELIYKH